MNAETVVKLNRFQCRNYQAPIFDAIENKGYKKVLAILPRRAGKDVAAFNLMIRSALRKVGVYYYILPTYSQARKVIWDSITNDGQRFLDYIPSELIARLNGTEMKITLINGSIIQLCGSTDYDRLMGTNPQGIVFSEYALQDPRAYHYLRPILTTNQGWAVFISCVAPDTLVLSDKGLQRIKDICPSRERYTDIDLSIYGLGGFHKAEQFYYSPTVPTKIITLANGFKIECTNIHPLWDGKEWVKSQDLRIGDLMPIQYGQDIWGSGISINGFESIDHGHIKWHIPEILTEDFMYLLGLIHAEGCYDNNKVCITNPDKEVINFLQDQGFKSRPDNLHHELSSKELCKFLEFLGFKHGARNKRLPNSLLSATKEQMRGFIQGVFDGDGTSHSSPRHYGRISLSSSCYEFCTTLQVILLNFGIVSSLYKEERWTQPPSSKQPLYTTAYKLEINGYFAEQFYEQIGFRVQRKQDNRRYISRKTKDESGNIYPIDLNRLDGYSLPKNIVTNKKAISRRLIKKLHEKKPHSYLAELLDEKLFYSPIVSIQDSESEVFDFVIPETHSFFSNGLISHNTVRGKNHLFELFQIASHSPDWFAYRMTVEETNHIPLAEIERERREGIMSEDLIQQEYYNSFDLGVEGAYYGKYLDKIRLNGQITQVPYEPGFKVHTAWDLGVRDSTAIIFFQVIGQTVRIIDYYENSKVGLEHYAKVLQEKDYIYGKHIAPHDIKVREFGTGMTRLEQARNMGVSFTVAHNLTISDGIEAGRILFNKLWIDESKCATLLKALENYRQEYDSVKKVYKNHPLHDQWSHASDAFRYLAISINKTREGASPEDIERRYQQAYYGTDSNMPAIFRENSWDTSR